MQEFSLRRLCNQPIANLRTIWPMTRRGHEFDPIELVLPVIHTIHRAMTHHRSYPPATLAKEAVRKSTIGWINFARPSRRPLRGLLSMRVFFVLSKDYLMLRSAGGRVSKHAPPRCSSAFVALNQFPDRRKPVPTAKVDPGLRGCREIPTVNPESPIPSFPRKRESRDFSNLPWAPAFAGATIWRMLPI